MSGTQDAEANSARAFSLLASGGRIWAITLNTFREAVRNRVMAVLFFFAVALMVFSLVLGELSLNEEERIIKDLGLAGERIGEAALSKGRKTASARVTADMSPPQR